MWTVRSGFNLILFAVDQRLVIEYSYAQARLCGVIVSNKYPTTVRREWRQHKTFAKNMNGSKIMGHNSMWTVRSGVNLTLFAVDQHLVVGYSYAQARLCSLSPSGLGQH